MHCKYCTLGTQIQNETHNEIQIEYTKQADKQQSKHVLLVFVLHRCLELMSLPELDRDIQP